MQQILLDLINRIKSSDPTLTSFKFSAYYLDDAEQKALVEALKVNTTLTSINLEQNKIRVEGAKALAEALKVNTTLTSMNLSHNGIYYDGAQALAEALKLNTTLTSMNLSDNFIRDDGAQALAEALKVNKSLTSLNLYYNFISSEGAKALAEALKVNTTLTSLDISYNSMGPEGQQALAEALIDNSTLVCLNIMYTGRFKPKKFEDALFVNESLLFLESNYLSSSRSTKWKEYINRNHKIFKENLEKALEGNLDEIKNIKVFYSQLKLLTNHIPKTINEKQSVGFDREYKQEDLKSAFEKVERYLKDNPMRAHGISKKSHLLDARQKDSEEEVEGTQLPQDMWKEIFKYVKPEEVKHFKEQFGEELGAFKKDFKTSQSSYKIVRFLVDIIRSITRVFKGPEEIPVTTKNSVDGLVKAAGFNSRKLQLIENFASKIEPRNPELGGLIKEKVARAKKPPSTTHAESVSKASDPSNTVGGRG